MRKLFDTKIMHMHETAAAAADDVRTASRKIGTAAETQATLNIALTAVAVAALLVAALLVQDAASREAGRGD